MFVLVKLNILLLLIVFIYSCDADYKKGKATTITLNDGNEIPVIGFGTSARVNTFNEVRHSVESAIDEGYRHIDTAAYYDTEGIVGDALKSKIQDGTVRREDLFITTKLWNDKHKEEEVVPALRTSLRKLGLNFVDLYLIHWPMSTDEHDNDIKYDYIYTWKGMEEAQRLGLAKSIGVSNFNQTQLERLILNGRVKPAVNQIEVNPNLSQKDLIKYCHDNDIHVVAYAPLGSTLRKRTS